MNRSAVCTINGSIGGGIAGMVYRFVELNMYLIIINWKESAGSTLAQEHRGLCSNGQAKDFESKLNNDAFDIFALLYSYIFYKNKLNIQIFVTGLLGGLVGITGNYF